MHERTTTIIDVWTYPEANWSTVDLTGFGVEATDGSIGTIDEATRQTGASFLIVDTGPWIFGRKVLLPAGVIDRVDLDNRKVFVGLTKDQINNAPELDESAFHDPQSREKIGSYYANRPAGPDYAKDDRVS